MGSNLIRNARGGGEVDRQHMALPSCRMIAMRISPPRSMAAIICLVLRWATPTLLATQALVAQTGGASAAPSIHTATTHPMKYQISLPPDWSPAQTWPVLMAPNAHYSDTGKSLAQFAGERDARHAPFIIVVPFVINADRVETMTEYRGAVANTIGAADAATDDGFRDEDARAKFDEDGICAVIKDVQSRYHGEDRVYITGFSSSTHVAYLFLFNHPELLKGVMINSGVFLWRGVDQAHVPLPNSSARAAVAVKFIIGEKDPGYSKCTENWEKTRRALVQCGHPAAQLQSEVITASHPQHLPTGHTWFPTRILDFCTAVEGARADGKH